MVKLPDLFFEFLVPLIIKWHLYKFTLSFFFLIHHRSMIDRSSSDLAAMSMP